MISCTLALNFIHMFALYMYTRVHTCYYVYNVTGRMRRSTIVGLSFDSNDEDSSMETASELENVVLHWQNTCTSTFTCTCMIDCRLCT